MTASKMNPVNAKNAKISKGVAKKAIAKTPVEVAAEAKLAVEDLASTGPLGSAFHAQVVSESDGGQSGGGMGSTALILGGIALAGGVAVAAAGGGKDTNDVPIPTPTPPQPLPSYSVAAPASVDEGKTVIFTITDANKVSGQKVTWSINPERAGDIEGPTSGEVTIDQNGKATVEIAIKADKATEVDVEKLILTVGSQNASVTINDTSETPPPAPQTFTLTTGVDISGELKGDLGTTSTAGDDTFKATVATLGSLDVIDGGAGKNTFDLLDSADVTSLVASVENFKTVNISTEGSIGSGAAAEATRAVTTLGENANLTTGTVELKVGSVSVTAATGSEANLGAAIVSALQAQGYTVVTSGTPTATQVKVDSSTSNVVTVTGLGSGEALPTISVVSGAAANLPSISVAAGTLATSATTFSVAGVDGLGDVNLVAGEEIVARAATTANIYAEAGGSVTLTGGKDVDVGLSIGGATVKGAKGAVSIYEAYIGNVVVEGGTTVTIYKEGSDLDPTTGQPQGSAYAGNVTVGVDAAFGPNPATATTFPQVDANVTKQPTGNVVVNNYTDYTTPAGQASRVYGSGTASVYTNGAAAVSVATAGAVTVKDVQVATRINSSGSLAVAGTSTLASVRIDGTNATGTVTSDALTSLTLVNAGASAAITVTNANLHALSLTLGNNTASSSVTDATATSVTIATEAQSISLPTVASASTTTINAANATSLTFNNAHSVKLGNSALANLTKLTSVVATGAGKVDIGDITGAGKLTSVDASAASGGLVATVGSTGSYGLTLKGSSGADTITLKASATLAAALVSGANVTTSISLGAGNDTLLNGGSVTVGAGVTIDGGDGVDTISHSLVNGSNAAIFQNFETLEVSGLNTAFDGAAMTTSAIANVALAGSGTSTTATTNTAEVRNLATTAATLSIGQYTAQANAAAGNVVNGVKLTLKDATGTADSLAINFAASVTTNSTVASGNSDLSVVGAVTQTGVESVTISSGGSTDLDANYLGQLVDTSNSMKTITITGAKAFTLADVDTNTAAVATVATTTASSLTLIDGSAATGILTITAGSSNVVGNVETVYTGLTIKGGDATTNAAGSAAGDVLTNNATSGVTYGGAGNDTITVGGSKQTVYGGTGGDIINVNKGSALVDVGTDAVNAVDKVVVGGPTVSATLANSVSGAEFTTSAAYTGSVYSSAANTAFSMTSAVTTITNLVTGDKIDLTAAGSASASVGKLSTALATDSVSNGTTDDIATAATTLDGLVNQAIADATYEIDWFVFQGDTYLVVNGAAVGDNLTFASSTNANANDYVIKLVGDYTTSLSSVAALSSSVLTFG